MRFFGGSLPTVGYAVHAERGRTRGAGVLILGAVFEGVRD